MPIQDLQEFLQFSMTANEIIKVLFISLFCGYIISLFYKWTYHGAGYSNSFIHSLIVMTMITSVVILVIGNNLARAFGLVGAMSIIRFRTAIKDTRDIVFIFLSLTIGLAAGVGLLKVAIISTIFICLVQFILFKLGLGFSKNQEYLLQFSYISSGDDKPEYLNIFKKYCKNNKLINVRSLGRDDMIELSFYLVLKNNTQSDDFIKQLRNLSEVETVNLYFDEDTR